LSPFIDKLFHNRARESNDPVLDVEIRVLQLVFIGMVNI